MTLGSDVPETNFDIYQTEEGYTAVTNEVRRVILDALAKKERGLPELVKITGKAKPTLSSVHMKELLGQNLVEELAHPTDNRKKIYRLRGRRIGSSNVPVDQLRSAVKHYVSLSPFAARLPLPVAFDAFASTPAGTDPAVVRAQSHRLGKLTAELFAHQDARDLVTAVAAFLEQEGLARPLRLDLEHRALELELARGLPAEASTSLLAEALAGFLDGILLTKGLVAGRSVAETLATPRRFTLRLAAAPARDTQEDASASSSEDAA